MILRLAIEQARSQRRYTIWTAVFLTFALTLVTFSLVVVATQREADHMMNRLWYTSEEHLAWVTSSLEEASVPVIDSWGNSYNPIPLDELDSLLREAQGLDSIVMARRETSLYFDIQSDQYLDDGFGVSSVFGPLDWDIALGEGSPPGPGEIVLCAAIAERRGVEVGDTITLYHPVWSGPWAEDLDWTTHTFTVSGLARSGSGYAGGYSSWAVQAYVSWEDSTNPDGLFLRDIVISDEGDTLLGVDTTVGWSGDIPSLAGLPGSMLYVGSSDWSSAPPATAWAAAGVALLVLFGTIITAFSVGRSQAQTRLQFVATARTLGATQRTIWVAALLEACLVGVVAWVAGLLLGWTAASLHLMLARSLVPLPLLPETVSFPLVIPLITAGVGLLMAVIISAVPAFWATRTSPVAALKPVTDVSQAEVSRRVSTRLVIVAFILGLFAFTADSETGSLAAVTQALGGVVSIVLGYLLLLELIRAMVPRLGRWLGRRRQAWAISAGDALTSRPRQAVARSFLFALAFMIFTAIVIDANLWSFERTDNGYLEFDASGALIPGQPDRFFNSGGFANPGTGALIAVLAVLFVLEIVALGAALADERAIAADSATRQALGMTGRDSRLSRAAIHGVPQVAGALTGAIVGYAVALYLHFAPRAPFSDGRAETAEEVFLALRESYRLLGLALGAALLVIAVGSFLLASGRRRETPVEALRPAGMVRAR